MRYLKDRKSGANRIVKHIHISNKRMKDIISQLIKVIQILCVNRSDNIDELLEKYTNLNDEEISELMNHNECKK